MRGHSVAAIYRIRCSSSFTYLICLLSLLAASGCSTLHGVPARYQPTAAIVESIKLTADDVAKVAMAETQAERNLYQNKAIAVVDLNFHQFVREVTGLREDVTAGTATTALVLSTTGALVNSAAA